MQDTISVQASESDRVRQFVMDRYVNVARNRGDHSVTVVAGDVHRSLGFRNRVPLVCMALKSNKFLEENGLVVRKIEGPPSGLSTTVAITYEWKGNEAAKAKVRSPLWDLLGKGREMFASLGGGEEFLRREREELNRRDRSGE